MTRALVIVAVALAVVAQSAAASVGRPVQLPIGPDDYGVENAIAVNDRGDRVVAYTPRNTLAIAYSRHGSTRFAKPRVVKPRRGLTVETPHVAIAASGAALVTWRETDESEYDPTDYRGDVVCCARTMAVVVSPNGQLHDRVAISPGSGEIESPDPALLSIRDEKHFGVAVATHRFRPQGLPYEDDYVIYERFSGPRRAWGSLRRVEEGFASWPLALTVTRAGSRLVFARTVTYDYDRALFEQTRDASGKAASARNLGYVLPGVSYPSDVAADGHGAFVFSYLTGTRDDETGSLDGEVARVVWAMPGGALSERATAAVDDYPEEVRAAMARNGIGVVAWADGHNIRVADYRDGDLGSFRTLVQRHGSVYNTSVVIASTGRWALADRGSLGLRVLLGRRGKSRVRSVILRGTRAAYGYTTGVDGRGVVSIVYSGSGEKPHLWVRRVH
jgi:hypothetical protein